MRAKLVIALLLVVGCSSQPGSDASATKPAPVSPARPTPADKPAEPASPDTAPASPDPGPDSAEAASWRAETPELPEMLYMAGAMKKALEANGITGSAVLLDARTKKLIVSVDTEAGATPGQPISHAPGSSVKPLLMVGALRAGVITPDFRQTCDGELELADQRLTCFASHGELDLEHALASSCNEYAYEVARRVGAPGVREYFERYGFGAATGLLEEDPAGAVPEVPSENPSVWAASVGTGHGDLAVSPAQLGLAYANYLAPPSDEAREAVIKGMIAAVEDPIGSATAVHVDGLRVAAKTGTAEGSKEDLYNSWLVALAPAERPDVVLVVASLDGGTAPKVTAPAAGAILAAWNERREKLSADAGAQ